jgi:chromosome segregation ATPase
LIKEYLHRVDDQSDKIRQLSQTVSTWTVEVESDRARRAEMEGAQELMLRKTREVAERVAQVKQEEADLQEKLRIAQETLQQKEKRIALQDELLELRAQQISLQTEYTPPILAFTFGKKRKSGNSVKSVKVRRFVHDPESSDDA